MSDRDSRELELARPLNTPSSSPIFRLNVDCCEEIIDLLSLKDLVAIGQTCKRMQSIAGYCFQQNYSHKDVSCTDNGLYANRNKIDIFTRFTRSLHIRNNVFKPFRFIKLNSFDSLKQIRLSNLELTNEMVSCMKKVLGTLESLVLIGCRFYGDLYEKILKFCGNLKELIIHWGTRDYFIGNSNHWFSLKYPKLEHIEFNSEGCKKEINEWKTFLENNSSIRSIAIDINSLIINQKSFLEANFKLETLYILHVYHSSVELKLIFGILNKLREKRSFRKLCFSMSRVDEQLLKEVDFLPIIEKLSFRRIDNNFGWHQLTGLKELHVEYLLSNSVDMARSLVNVEKITIKESICIEHIMPFVRYSAKIREITFKLLHFGESNNIDVHKMINERKKLAGAQKVVIYVPEDVYLASKCSRDEKDMALVQMKRDVSNSVFF